MTGGAIQFRFGDFEFDVVDGVLRFRSERIAMTPKALAILALLLRYRGRIVEREHFIREVWPDTFVGDSTLAQNILTLRKTLARYEPTAEFIVTIPRRGYQFVGDVTFDRDNIAFDSPSVDYPARGAGLATGGHVTNALLSPDGQTVLFLIGNVTTGEPRLNRIAIDRTRATELTDRSTRAISVSPDGRTIACSLWDAAADRMIVAVISADTGEITAFPPTPRNDDILFLGWSPDGAGIYAVLRRAGPVSLWKISVSGREPIQLREWDNEVNLQLVITKDGQQIRYKPE